MRTTLWMCLAMMLAISTTVNAETLEIPTGGGSSASVPSISPNLHEEIHLPGGFHVQLFASNREETTETWEYNGETYIETRPKETYMSVDLQIEQGALGHSFLPVGHGIEIRRWYNDPRRLHVDMEWTFILADDPADVTDWTEPPAGGMSIDFGGLDIWGWSSFEKQTLHEHDEFGNCTETMTDNINGYGSFRIQDAETINADLDIRDWTYWWDQEYSGMRIEGSFEILMTGDEQQVTMAKAMFEEMPVHAPEPGTMVMLGIGGIASLLRKRRRKS
jgi:hypothetical protein